MALVDRAIGQLDRARRIRPAHGTASDAPSMLQLDRARANLASFRDGRRG